MQSYLKHCFTGEQCCCGFTCILSNISGWIQSIQLMKWHFHQFIQFHFIKTLYSLSSLSKPATAELLREAFFVLLKTHSNLFSLSLCHLFFFLSLSEMTPPCLPPNPFILVFTPSTCLPPTPLQHLSSSTSCTSPLPFLAFKDDTSRAEKTPALLLSAITAVILCSSQVSPRSLASGFYLTLRRRAREQREPHYAESLPSLPGARCRTIFSVCFFFKTRNMGMWFCSFLVRLCCFEQKNTTSYESCLCFLSVFLQPISNADFIVPVEIDGTVHQVLLHWYAGLLELGLNEIIFINS